MPIEAAVPPKPAKDPCPPCDPRFARAAYDACEKGRQACKAKQGNQASSSPAASSGSSGGGGGGQPSGGGGGGASGAGSSTPMVQPLSTMPPMSSGGGVNPGALQNLLTAPGGPAPPPAAYTPSTPNMSEGLFQQRGNQLRAQGQAAGQQAGRALTNQFAGRGFSTDSAALAQQNMLAAMMGNAQGIGAANKDQLAMGGEDQSYAAIRRQMEQDRLRNQMMQQQAGVSANTALLGYLM